MPYYDIIGTFGVVIILIAYAGLQFDKLESNSFWYCCLNIIGSLAIVYSLFFEWNLSAFLMEIVWIGLSVYGLIKTFK